MNTNEAYSRLREVVRTIRKNFMEDGYMVDPHEIELANDLDPNEQQLHSEMHGALSSLETVCELLVYYDMPVLATGKLQRNNNGRFELGGVELTSGAPVELLVYDPEWDKAPHWVRTRIEYDTDYYAVYQHMSLEGKTARIRK